jgi:hypothetical protein
VPLALLGFHPALIALCGGLNLVYQFWIHTEAVRRMPRWFEWLFNTPSHHRVHHGSDPKYLDRNHAGTLIVWDRLFGTYQPEEEEPVYGITAPLHSWDPVRANLHYWQELGALAAQCDHWTDKVRVFLKPPGWRPASLGGPVTPVRRDRATYRKFDTRAPRTVMVYVALQFALLLAISTFFLFRQGTLEASQQWGLAAFIVLGVMDLGLLLGPRRWAAWVELLRIGGVALLFAAIGPWGEAAWGIPVLVVACLASLLHLAFAARALARDPAPASDPS